MAAPFQTKVVSKATKVVTTVAISHTINLQKQGIAISVKHTTKEVLIDAGNQMNAVVTGIAHTQAMFFIGSTQDIIIKHYKSERCIICS